MATEFEVRLDGPTSSLLKAIEVLAEEKINLDTVSIAPAAHGYVVRFLTGADESVRTSMMKADLPFRENQVLVIQVPNRPGQWLRVADALAKAGVEVSHTYQVGGKGRNNFFAFGVSDYGKAKKICTKLGRCDGY